MYSRPFLVKYTHFFPFSYLILLNTCYFGSGNMYQSDALDDWFRTRVAALLPDEDVYTDYVKGTLQDEDSDVSARVCNACEFLSSASAGVLAEEEQTKLLNAAEMKAEVEEIVAIAQMYLQWNRSKPNSRN